MAGQPKRGSKRSGRADGLGASSPGSRPPPGEARTRGGHSRTKDPEIGVGAKAARRDPSREGPSPARETTRLDALLSPETAPEPELYRSGELTPAEAAQRLEDMFPALNKSALPKVSQVGKDANGRNIPHKRSEEVARQVEVYARNGASDSDIAMLLNIRPGQLRQIYADELRKSKMSAHLKVAEAIYAQASTPGNPRMSEFYAKAQMGWDDNPKGKNSDPFSIHIHVGVPQGAGPET